MSHFLIYFILKLDDLCVTFAIIFIVTSISSVFLIPIWMALRDEMDTDPEVDEDGYKLYCLMKKITRYILFTLLISGAVSLFVPDTKQMAAIYIIPKMAKNKQLTNIPNQLIKLTNLYIENQFTKLKKEHS